MLVESEKPRVMGFWRTWGLAIGMMVGSGVFMLPTVLAPYGKLGLMSWVVTGTGTIAMALALAFMARRVPKEGGPYAYSRAGFGGFAGFLMAWGYWISLWTAVAAVTVASLGYISVFLPILRTSNTLAIGTGLLIIWSLVYLNCRSIKDSSVFQLVTSLAKLLPLLFLATVGLFGIESANFDTMLTPSEPPLSALAAASVLAMWAFIGFEVATIPAGDIKDPAKTIPRATIAAVMVVVVLYLAVSVAVFGLVPAQDLVNSTAPLADAATRLVGPIGALVIAAVAIIATVSGVNANLLVAGHMPMAAALDGLFPRRFARLTKSGTPAFGFVVGGMLASFVLVFNYVDGLVAAFEFLILISTLSALIPITFSTAAAWLFSVRTPSPSKFRRVRDTIASIIGFLYTIWAIAGSGRDAVYWGFLLLLAGVPVYVWMQVQAERKENS
ncbi:amino acid permease [Kordiimonas gwangyangensis]|uniref:APC family permease n=1 Tax=Kordiimonas gwangyangensis TaxID=288022 RepID=UPI00037190BA